MVRPTSGPVLMTRFLLRRANLSTRRLLVRRVRFILAMCVIGATTFALLDLATSSPDLLRSLLFKAFGVSLGFATMVLVGQPWAVRRARPLAIPVVSPRSLLTERGS